MPLALSAPGSPQEAGGWVTVPGACQRASRRLLPDPYPALACGDAETTHIAVGHRVLLPTPLGTHEASMREEAMHIQIERDFTGPRVQTDHDRVLVALARKDIDPALCIHVH